jgi:hypothetical protein
MGIFGETVINLSKRITLNFIDIENYSVDLLSLINNEIAKIWDGDLDDNDLETVKIEFNDWLKKKKPAQKHGFISEFICHLFLRSQEYEQYFLFRNLEEKGPKKGFDGVFMNNLEFWIYESKCTLSDSKIFNHNTNIGEAYNDIKKKITGVNSKNNPWKNAYTHSNNHSIKRNQSLINALKDLSKRYVRKDYEILNNYNIIPSSVIYMGDKFNLINHDELKKNLKSLLSKYDAKKINVICINKKTIDNFEKFLEN